MLQIQTTSRFDRRLVAFVKAHPDLHDKIEDLIDSLSKNPFNHKSKTHPLTGKLKGLHAASINWHYRLVFEISLEAITLINIGSHDEVY